MTDPATPAAAVAAREVDVGRWSSLCNCVVNFLLQEKYLLTAFELLHELAEDGRHDHAIRLRDYFSDKSLFPPDQISAFNALRVADPQSLLEEKISLAEKLAVSEYELRLAQEDLSRMKEELQNRTTISCDEDNGLGSDAFVADVLPCQLNQREASYASLGSLKDTERKDLNCAVKEYLLCAGYRLTAMTFLEEVADQNLDVWLNSAACVPDALRHYYYHYLSSTSEAAEERISILQENESLLKDNERLNYEKVSILRSKELTDGHMSVVKKSLEVAQKDLKDRDILVQDMKKSLDIQRQQLNDCRAEITALKMQIEGAQASRGWTPGEIESTKPLNNDISNKEKESSSTETGTLDDSRIKNLETPDSETKGTSIVMNDLTLPENPDELLSKEEKRMLTDVKSDSETVSCNGTSEPQQKDDDIASESSSEKEGFDQSSESHKKESCSEKMALETIQIISDTLPKIVPFVLINHREELIPMIMCAIERHPESTIRDSLTHTLFNLIKRPDEQQRRIIMDACVSLAKNVGEMRTETELLPQCWEQINHKYEERRLLVAQSCGELAEFVRPEIRDSLILSIVQQLIEDSATVVREAAALNLALLLPLFPNLDKYFKVEGIMFQLVCDPSGLVVDTTLKKLVPALIKWGGKLDHVQRVVLSHMLGSAQRCPPLSGVEGSLDSHIRSLGERERWNIDVLLRMLIELLPYVHQKAIETCPFNSHIDSLTIPEKERFFSTSLLQTYGRGTAEWSMFDWMHVDCLPDLIRLSCFLSQNEDKLRIRITKYLLDISAHFGDQYLEHIMLPVFLVAVGDTESADLTFFPVSLKSRIKGLRPKTAMAERLSVMCVLPLLLSGILGTPNCHEKLLNYLRKVLVLSTTMETSWFVQHTSELINAIRFLCIFKEHHGMVFNVLWEMVVSSNANMKSTAAKLLKVFVPYVDEKVASTHVLPALITLGSDQHLSVKYASIDAFGSVAQHFKNDMIIDKIRVQMDAFLEDGSHEATVSVIRALVVAIPHTTEKLKEYLLSKIFQLSGMSSQGNDVALRREKANVFCEAIRALDATDLPATNIHEFLLPAIQNLLKDPDALDPAHKEALEIIAKERSGGAFETISKVMGAHLGLASSVTNFFGESGLRAKKESGDMSNEPAAAPQPSSTSQQDDTSFRRIMRGSFGDMLRGKGKGSEESPKQ